MSESQAKYIDFLHADDEPEEVTLHPAELNLIRYIRRAGFCTLSVKVEYGLPERGYDVKESIIFNRKGGRINA